MDAASDIKSRLAIEDVIGRYIQLKRAGRNFKGLSPFTNEKTASFVVSPDKNIWHDFSSGQGGDIFSFVMIMEGLDFRAALELLARQAGVDLERYRGQGGRPGTELKKKLVLALEQATRLYQACLKPHQTVLDYAVRERGLNQQTISLFRLGYAPGGQTLQRRLSQRGLDISVLEGAGLVSRYRGQPRDLFNQRLMIPLMDGQGQVIGFTGRLLGPGSGPKYLNTPSTLLYDKSRHIFGLHLAKAAIRQAGYAVIAEGNMDVISSHQAGVRQVVATAGTALTMPQLKTLGRLAPEVRLAYDNDRAGVAATERALPLAASANLRLSVVTLGGGKDPDEVIRRDPDAWRRAIDEAVYAPDWLIDTYRQQVDITTAEGKKRLSDEVLKLVARLPDEVEREHYLGRLAELLAVSRRALADKLQRQPAEQRPLKQVAIRPSLPPNQLLKLQGRLLALALMRPPLGHYLRGLHPQMMSGQPAAQLLGKLQEAGDALPPQLKKQLSDLPELGDYVKMLQLQFEELYAGVELSELRDEAARLRSRLISEYVRTQKHQLAQAMRSAGQSELPALLKKARQLDRILKSH